MQEIINRLEKWRLERGLDRSQGFEFDLETQASFIFEEIGVEYLRAKDEYEKIDALCDTVVFCVNAASLLGYNALGYKTHGSVSISKILENAVFLLTYKDTDIIGLICAKCVNIIKSMGYDFYKCMNEILKEVESRIGAFNPETGKWEKFKTDEAKALWYKADYSKCKMSSTDK